jgi:FkbM family methyltransferase
MKGAWKVWVQQAFGHFGFQVRRLNRGVNLEDPFSEQLRFADPKATTVFEVGAADGRDCLSYAESFPLANVFAFEPIPSSFSQIELRARDNPRIYPVNEAMAEKVGTAKFHISQWHDASSLMQPKKTGSTFDEYTASCSSIEVKVNTIDNFCAQNKIEKIDILKMDAQGAELKILEGAKESLDRRMIKLIYTEVSFLEIYVGAVRFDQLMSFLVDHGFRFHNLYGLNHNQKGELTQADAIFVLDSAR